MVAESAVIHLYVHSQEAPGLTLHYTHSQGTDRRALAAVMIDIDCLSSSGIMTASLRPDEEDTETETLLFISVAVHIGLLLPLICECAPSMEQQSVLCSAAHSQGNASSTENFPHCSQTMLELGWYSRGVAESLMHQCLSEQTQRGGGGGGGR